MVATPPPAGHWYFIFDFMFQILVPSVPLQFSSAGNKLHGRQSPLIANFPSYVGRKHRMLPCCLSLPARWYLTSSIQEIMLYSVQGSGCMDQKKTKNWTELDRLGPDWRLQLPAFQNKKTAKKPVATDQLQSVAIGFIRYSSKIRTFWAYFEENQARNAHAMAKMICYGEIRLCMTSRSCIFWVLDNFYYHKNYIGSYYTL